jgi:hypothetical protein
MKGAQSHEELVVWQLSYQLKLGVYDLIRGESDQDRSKSP